jgi:ribosomal protein S18 acetylase RimI-like enzyme
MGGPAALTAKEMGARLDLVEEFYARCDAPPRVQITPVARPIGLDAALAARGYRVEAPVDVLVADLRVVLTNASAPRADAGPEPHTETAPTLPEAWLAQFAAADPIASTRAEAYARLVSDLPLETVGVGARDAGAIAAIGFGVFERGWLGVFGMATAPERRDRGLGTAVLRALAGAAAARGIRRSYLQVEQQNHAARALYEHLGFRFAYSYHYRLGDHA